MSIGATLAAARRRAGLTVSEVSNRTRVRESIIQGIEHDDYAACGGDFYARGHIRAIAQAVGEDPAPLVEEYDETWRSEKEMTAAEVSEPAMPSTVRERRRVRRTAALALAVLAVLGFASYKFVSDASGAKPAAAVTSQHPVRSGPPTAPASTPGVQASTAQAGATATGSATGSTTPAAVRVLAPASVAAFGPAGTADGDDPARASLAIAGNRATPWTSDWYATADFGNLQAGTGLLLDMGRTVTVTSVRVSLGGGSGADLQLRAGDTPALADLPQVASSSGMGGTVQLPLGSPAHARYLLIWFTKLPGDAAGTYQASVYQIRVQGRT